MIVLYHRTTFQAPRVYSWLIFLGYLEANNDLEKNSHFSFSIPTHACCSVVNKNFLLSL